jgi:beta-propeller repeat-containing protein
MWSTNFGGPNVATDSAVPTGIVVDRSGASVVVGYLKGRVDFGGGSLISAGAGDVYLVKYASDGSYLWSQRFGAAGDDRAKGIAIDGADNIVITGFFHDTVSFGGTALVSAPFTANAFIAKFNAGGTHLWSRRVGSGVNTDTGNTVAIDGPGNVYVGGSLFGTTDFGSGPLASAGGEDIFLAKYASNGTYSWARRFGGTSTDSVVDVAADTVTGEVAMTGYFAGAAEFGSGVFVTSAGGNDAFVAKYSTTGAHEWSGPWGNTGDDRGASVAIDNLGNVAVTGLCNFSVNFGGGPLPAAGDGASGDIFLVKLSPNGLHTWSKSFGSSLSLNEVASAVNFDSAGYVLLTGSNVGTVNYGGGALAGDGWYNIFVARFDPNGVHSWSKRYIHGGGNANGRSVAAGANDNVLASGDYDVSVNFGGATLTSPGATDTYLVKLSR